MPKIEGGPGQQAAEYITGRIAAAKPRFYLADVNRSIRRLNFN
jgi:hypothetical protein